jgi:hypothetical protein
MAAGNYDFILEQGADKTLSVTLKDKFTGLAIDITGWTILCQHRLSWSSGSVLVTPTPALSDPINGVFTLTYTAAQLAALPANKTIVYDVLATRLDTKKIRIFQGKNFVSPRVSQ